MAFQDSRHPASVPPFMLLEPMVTRPRMIIHRFSTSPMFPSQFNTQSSTGQPNSQLTADEQATILKKLRKDTYNPSPRRFSRMVGIDYHDQNSARTRFDPRDDGEDSKRCAVCLEDFESGEEVKLIMPCDHMFHKNCIVPWVEDHGRCPICRFSLHEREVPKTQAYWTPETVPQQWEAVLFVPPLEANLTERQDEIRKDGKRIFEHNHKVKFVVPFGNAHSEL